MKDQIRIILIGDTGTGKSSVITSYISKYFPNEVPAVLVDAIIPIDSTANNVSVTIMDSSALLGDRDVLHQKIRMADSIISLFDVTRPETIDSLEELWLPTIRDICSPYPVSKAVIVVGNKTDLVGSDEEVEKMRMKKILKDFPFVVACYRCSAKLGDVDQIFYESELAVTFPIGPLFDTSRSEFTSACKVAFLRIFRCFDLDQDGLLSDKELNSLQQQSFGIPLKDEEVTALKQEIAKSVRGGMMNESITFKGLMGIMRLFIYRGQQQTPWTMLARFGCEDRSFTLEIPPEVEEEQELADGETFELTRSAFEFLYNLAINAPSWKAREAWDDLQNLKDTPTNAVLDDKIPARKFVHNYQGGEMTWGDLKDILSVMPDVTHPWSYAPICQDVSSAHIFLLSGVSTLRIPDGSLVNSVSEIGLSTSSNQHSIGLSNIHTSGVDGSDVIDANMSMNECGSKVAIASVSDDVMPSESDDVIHDESDDAVFCSVDAWMAQWQMLAVHRPILVQTLLFRMGYIERQDLGLTVVTRFSPTQSADKRVLNVCFLGGVGVGKADLLRAMSNLAYQPAPPTQVTSTSTTERGTQEVEIGDIEAGGYPLHVLRTGYDCDMDSRPPHGMDEHKSKFESVYVHGSCPYNTASSRLSIVFTAVPYDRATAWIGTHGKTCDLAIMVLDCGDMQARAGEAPTGSNNSASNKGRNDIKFSTGTSTSTSTTSAGAVAIAIPMEDEDEDEDEDNSSNSLQAAKQLESLLPPSLPRIYVGNRSDLLESKTTVQCIRTTGWNRGSRSVGAGDDGVQDVLQPALEHIAKHQLPPLIKVSPLSGEGIEELRNEIFKVTAQPHLGIPAGHRNKERNNKFVWVAGRVMCAVVTVTVAVVIVMWGRDTCKEGEESRGSKCMSWVRQAMIRVLSATGQRES